MPTFADSVYCSAAFSLQKYSVTPLTPRPKNFSSSRQLRPAEPPAARDEQQAVSDRKAIDDDFLGRERAQQRFGRNQRRTPDQIVIKASRWP